MRLRTGKILLSIDYDFFSLRVDEEEDSPWLDHYHLSPDEIAFTLGFLKDYFIRNGIIIADVLGFHSPAYISEIADRAWRDAVDGSV